MRIGLRTFGEVGVGAATGRRVDAATRLSHLIRRRRSPIRTGSTWSARAERPRADTAVSAAAVVLAAIAARTSRIRLTSAMSVRSSDDPERVHQSFATLDAISGGRAEIMAGRGSFMVSFPLVGYRLDDHEAPFEAELAMLMRLNEGERVSWPGGPTPQPSRASASIRAPWRAACRSGSRSAARPPRGSARDPSACRWRSPSSAARPPASRRWCQPAARRRGGASHDAGALPGSINLHGVVAETAQGAAEAFHAPRAKVMDRIGPERVAPELRTA